MDLVDLTHIDHRKSLDQPAKRIDVQMKMKNLGSYCIILIIFLLLTTGCAPQGTLLPLAEDPFQHPSGIFTILYPENWLFEDMGDSGLVWLRSPSVPPDIQIALIAEALPGETEEEMSQAAQDSLEETMAAILPYQDYEIYNNAEIRVARNPAIVLDIARPLADGYHVGRLVLIYLPGHLVFLMGFGKREAWDPFLPTFRKMVDEMTFSVQPFPVEE